MKLNRSVSIKLISLENKGIALVDGQRVDMWDDQQGI
jgi:hypothetical protein